jgi:hypothetical protein
MMTLLSKTTLGTVLAAGALALSAGNLSAAIACSGNVCWHTQERYEYPPEARVIIHPDDWRWRRHERYVWREHEGRGYWRGGHWMGFDR